MTTQTETIPGSTLGVFTTFDGYRKPEFLHVQSLDGNSTMLDDLPDLGLAIVGTRHPQSRSLALLEEVMRNLRGSGLVILSGFARGIDSAAHALALKNGLRTLAILGAGIDIDYPRENRRLRQEILEAGGLIISPYPAGTAPIARNFIERNALIAGFAKATWVVEAAAISGTLNTASWATRFNRALYATSCFPGDPFFEGNEKLLGQRRTESYPVAEAFFGVHSLGSSWTSLGAAGATPELPFRDPRSRKGLTALQRRVLEIRHANGECHTQALLLQGLAQGEAGCTAPGEFLLRLEEEIRHGLITRDDAGRLEVGREQE
ncbi:MAG: DNA-processing protein DprA [Proteobacteria bacterium]|nr:DNA-processing protein DprA [Pseudomonadota bacterium]